MRRVALAAFALLAGGASGCAGSTAVERVYGGDVLEGRYVEPRAYSAYLRGVLAEGGGHPGEALDQYADAARRDPDSPEIWTRIGDVRCAANPRDPEAERALSRALTLDPAYAPAWSVRGRCALSRGDAAGARAAESHASALDPDADVANVALARAASGVDLGPARARLVALTQSANDPALAWDALATWAGAHGDVALAGVALRELVRWAPSRRADIGRQAEALAGAGEIGEARAVAGAVADAHDEPLPASLALTARLALDEAIARGDLAAVQARCTRGRLPLDEGAGRALLAGNPGLARQLAAVAARGDPSARGARLVLAAADGGDLRQAALEVRPSDPPVAGAALVAFAVALGRQVPAAAAAALLAPIVSEPIVGGDDPVERAAVSLALRGELAPARLPADGWVELAALRGDPAPAPSSGLDARHELLALAMSRSGLSRAAELARRVAPGDPVAAAGRALLESAGPVPATADAARRLLAMNAADPLLAAMAMRLTKGLQARLER